MRQVLALARTELGMDIAFVSEVTDGHEVLRAFDGAGEPFAMAEGVAMPLEDTYCQRVLDGVIGNVVQDAKHDERVRHLPGTRMIGAYIGVPLRVSARLYMLCCLAGEARPSLDEADVRFLLGLRETAARGLATAPPETRFSPLVRPRLPEPPPDPAASLMTLLRHVPVGVAFFDPDLRLVQANDRWADSAGLGQWPVGDGRVAPVPPAAVRDRLKRVLETGEPELDCPMQEKRTTADGSSTTTIAQRVSLFAIWDDAHRVVGVCAIAEGLS